VKISIEQPDGTFRELFHAYEASWTIDGERVIWVSPRHPDLYGVARRAEAESDKPLMRAVMRAAHDAPKERA
jgi:hypothetical protein